MVRQFYSKVKTHKLLALGVLLVGIAGFGLSNPVPAFAATRAAQDTSRGTATSTFSVPSLGDYVVWSRIMVQDTSNTSYILEVDGTSCGNVIQPVAGTITPNTWTWVKTKMDGTPMVLSNLAAGNHTATMIGRGDNLKLDRLIFTTDPNCQPAVGTTGDNCANPPDTTPPTLSITTPAANATLVGSNTIKVKATDDTAISKVEFYVDNTLVGTDTTADDANGTYSYALNTVTASIANGSHTIKVIAYDTASTPNKTTQSVAVTVNNPVPCSTGQTITAPTLTQKADTTSTKYTTIKLGWSAATPSTSCTITGYHIYKNGSTTPLATVTDGSNSYTDTGLVAGETDTYKIDAYDSGPNTSAKSGSLTASTAADDQAPTVPANVTASSSSASKVSLSWGASTDNPSPGGAGVAGYYIYRATGSASFDYTTPTYTVTSGTTYDDTNVSASTTYKYAIAAFDKTAAGGNPSAPSTVVTATTAAPTCSGAPSKPTLSKGTVGLTTLTVNWTASTASTGCTLSGYHVYRDGKIQGDATGTTFNDSGLLPGILYSYTVVAYDTSAHTTTSDVLGITTTADTVKPVAPATLTASTISPSEVDLIWDKATDNVGVVSYNIYRGTGTATPTLLKNVNNLTSLLYGDTSVTDNTDYVYQVTALDAAGNESSRTTISPSPVHTPKSVDTTPPTMPTNLQAPVTTAQGTQLTWTASTDNKQVQGYHIYLRVNNGSTTKDLPITDTTTPNFTTAGSTPFEKAAWCIQPKTTYTYVVVAFDTSSNVSDVATTQVMTPAGVQGDVNCSGKVDGTDVGILFGNWQKSDILPGGGNISGDNKVNGTDIGILYGKWRSPAP